MQAMKIECKMGFVGSLAYISLDVNSIWPVWKQKINPHPPKVFCDPVDNRKGHSATGGLAKNKGNPYEPGLVLGLKSLDKHRTPFYHEGVIFVCIECGANGKVPLTGWHTNLLGQDAGRRHDLESVSEAAKGVVARKGGRT